MSDRAVNLLEDLELRTLVATGEAELRAEENRKLREEAGRLQRRAQANRVVASEVRRRRPNRWTEDAPELYRALAAACDSTAAEAHALHDPRACR